MEKDALAETFQEKRKRIRKAPYRKWSDQEQQHLVNFLRENRPNEKPTAQIYYKRFLKEIGSEIDWSLVRCKVKNMKHSYIKAKNWSNSNDARLIQDVEAKHSMLIRICPFFEELKEVFPDRVYKANAFVLDNENSNTLESETSTDDTAPIFATACPDSSVLLESPFFDTETPRSLCEAIYSRTELPDVLGVPSSSMEVKLKKLEADREFQEKVFLLEEKKLNFEKEKLASKERFKILDLEMKERIAMKELEMKERLEMKKLDMQK